MQTNCTLYIILLIPNKKQRSLVSFLKIWNVLDKIKCYKIVYKFYIFQDTFPKVQGSKRDPYFVLMIQRQLEFLKTWTFSQFKVAQSFENWNFLKTFCWEYGAWLAHP